jgi:16S rRNA (cytidine1402-2'-O)-methyltransferase
VVATPIGNLGDITGRALDILRGVAWIAAEDTRVTAKLLGHYAIAARTLSLHEHNERTKAERVIALLREGADVALVSDAGTPAVSDPGALLVRAVRAAGLPVVPLPGPCAAIAALSASGMDAPHWLFHGFLAHKSGARRKELEGLKTLPHALVFYESPHRILETVADLAQVLGGGREITLARELTKTFETFHACRLGEAVAWLEGDANQQKGEFVLIVSGAPAVQEEAVPAEAERALKLLLAELPLKQAAKLAAEITGAKKNALYDRALELKKE